MIRKIKDGKGKGEEGKLKFEMKKSKKSKNELFTSFLVQVSAELMAACPT